MKVTDEDKNTNGNTKLVAIDIGSNSFHMLIARMEHGELRVIDILSEKVQLGSGLKNGKLLNSSIELGLACLSRFSELLSGISTSQIRIVGTNALRKAKNRLDFIEPAQKLLGIPIEVIYGREEARLIYLGVAHSLADDCKSRLVIDIGGGSTEFVIGEKFEPILLESLQIGCVSFTERYFPEGRITQQAFQETYEAAALEVSHISGNFQKNGWVECVGSSGTLQSIEAIAIANNWIDSGINLTCLELLKKNLLKFQRFDEINIEGLNDNRKNVIVTGVAITLALFRELNITSMIISKGALREGVIYDLVGRLSHEDVRERTIKAVMLRYGVNQNEALSVAARTQAFFECVCESWSLDNGDRDILHWASLTLEIGMLISHKHYNRHSAYLLRNSDLPGFSQGEQEKLAILATAHRGRLKNSLLSSFSKKDARRLSRMIALVRLAVMLKYIDKHQSTPTLSIAAKKNSITIRLPRNWLLEHPLSDQALRQENKALEIIGLSLEINESSVTNYRS